MQLGMIGLGRMGANMVQRLMHGGHECVVFDMKAASVNKLAKDGAVGAKTLEDFVSKLEAPRAVWLMVPAAAVDKTGATPTTLTTSGGPMNSSPKVSTMSTPERVAGSGVLSAGTVL